MLKDAIDLTKLQRVLVIKLRHHGDVLLTSPLISQLKQAAPHLEIDALVYQDTQDMLSGHPDLLHVWCIDKAWKTLPFFAKLRAEWQCLKQLKRRQYDLIIHLTEHNRGAWLVRYLKPRYAVAPTRAQRFFRHSFTHLYPEIAGNRRHRVEIHLDALRRIGVYPEKTQRQLVLTYPPAAQAKVDTLLAQAGWATQRFIVIHPASRWFFKCWPAHLMQTLITTLQQRHLYIVLTGAPDAFEQAYIAQILPAPSPYLLNLQGQLSLKELAALIAQAAIFIGMDSVPMHIAAAVGTPTIALFGPSGEIEWGPWQTRHHILTAPQYTCRPCGKDGCGGGKRSECLEAIPVRQVIAALDDLLMAQRY
jgi:heptosyltransferase-3